MRKPQLRNNIGQFQKYATLAITKELEAIADNTEVNVKQVIADQLKKTYIDNLKASYGPRSKVGRMVAETHKRKTSTYHHEHKLEEAVNVTISGKYIKVVINGDITYDDGTPATQVYKWLTEGTTPPKNSYYPYDLGDGFTTFYRNYPTPAHLFEEHTTIQMKGFLNSLENRIKNGEYTTYKYTGKKKKRTHYRGQEV